MTQTIQDAVLGIIVFGRVERRQVVNTYSIILATNYSSDSSFKSIDADKGEADTEEIRKSGSGPRLFPHSLTGCNCDCDTSSKSSFEYFM